MSDLERQSDEIEVLSSIYDNDFILSCKWPGAGCLKISPVPPEEHFDLFIITTVNDRKLEETVHLKYLPPIELYFRCPSDYPSKSQPYYMLKCGWLSDTALCTICKQLDSIWDRHGGEILYEWAYFLKEDSISFLKIKNLRFTLDMSVEKNPDSCPSTVVPRNLRLRALPNRLADNKNRTDNIKADPKFPDNFLRKKKLIRRRAKKDQLSEFFKYETPKEALIRINLDSSGKVAKDEELGQSCSKSPLGDQKQISEQDLAAIELDYILNMIHVYGVRRSTSVEFDSRVLPAKLKSRHQQVHRQYENGTPKAVDIVHTLIDYNREWLNKIFHNEWHYCGICFEQKKGLESTCLPSCSHIFCLDCVREYLRINISNANVSSLRCPNVDCETLIDRALIREIVDEETFRKYDIFSQKMTVENDPSLMYCPRPVCQGVARRCLELSSDIGYCPRCSFYFCLYCKRAYHGVQTCQLKNEERLALIQEYKNANSLRQAELEKRYGKQIREWVDEFLTQEWFQSETKPCPNCSAPIQKNDGCNKMLCSNCTIPFCWLCDKCLSRTRPYDHFRDPQSTCYRKLFLGQESEEYDFVEEGDELDFENDLYFQDDDDDENYLYYDIYGYDIVENYFVL